MMANIVPSTDGQINVATLSVYWNSEVAKNCLAIFQYNGPETPEISTLVTQTRSRIQDINALMAKILAELPAQ
jgi:hypothetical protein